MMDEGSVMERAHFTVVPLTAVLRSISVVKEQMRLVLQGNPRVGFAMCFGGFGLRTLTNPPPPKKKKSSGLKQQRKDRLACTSWLRSEVCAVFLRLDQVHPRRRDRQWDTEVATLPFAVCGLIMRKASSLT